MKNQSPKLIQEIISRFHRKRFRAKAKSNFHLWLISQKDYVAKDMALHEVWHSIPSAVTNETFRSLHKVKIKLGMTHPRKQTIQMNRILARVAAVFLPVVMFIGGYFIYESMNRPAEWARMEVPYGDTAHHVLDDGTNVWLNAGSVLEYPVKFRGKQREVRLYGEGFFDVAPQKRMPFIVQTECLKTQVVGTIFNVCCYGDLDLECITVLGGQVVVTTQDNEMHELVPNNHLTYLKDGMETIVEEVDAASMICWMQNGLVFEESTYEDILHTLRRKFNIKVIVDPAHYSNTKYRLWFINDEPLEYILEVVHQLIGLSYKFENETLTVGEKTEKKR